MSGPISSPHLSIVIPAYNEEHRLAATLPRVLRFLEQRIDSHEVLVVDDGSRDRTAEVAHSFAARGVSTRSLASNQGKGAAVRAGVLASQGRRVLISDADLSTPIEDLERLEAVLSKAPVIVGSRALAESKIGIPQPLHRRLMGWAFRQLVGWLAIRGIRDTQCGFKLLDGPTARCLFREVITEGFSFDVELLFLARRHGVAIREVAVRWDNDSASKVRPWIDPFRMLLEILAFRLHHRRIGSRPGPSAEPWAQPSEGGQS